MTALVINDLPVGKDLDRAAMASITGGDGGHCRRGKGKGRRSSQSQRVDFSDSVFKNHGDVNIVIVGDDVNGDIIFN